MDELIRLIPLAVWIAAIYLFPIMTRGGFVASPAEKFGRRCHQVLGFAVWPVALISVGNFSVRQGIVLGLMLAWLAHLSGKALNKSPHRFHRYVLEVKPFWTIILEDFKLLTSPEGWPSIWESIKQSPYSVLRDGVKFTVVQQGGGEATALPKHARENHIGWQEVGDFDAVNEEDPPLIFWNQHQTFGTTFDFRMDMTPIQFEKPDVILEPRPATFFMRLHRTYTDNPRGQKYRPSVLAGFDFGIEVPRRWWERVKDSCPASVRVDSESDSPFVSLILATLPLSEFYKYRNPPDRESYAYFRETEPYLRKRRDENREKFGWTAQDYRWTTTLCHKYFEVEHRAI